MKVKKLTKIFAFSIVLIYGILLIVLTTDELLKLPESGTKSLAITLMIPIIGALMTGITIELAKFLLDRNEKENTQKKEKIELLTKLAISLTTNMISTKNKIRYIDVYKFSDDMNAFISTIISEVDKKTVTSITPLLNLLLSKGENSIDEYKNSLGKILVNIRKSYGYQVDSESEKIIIRAII